MKIRGIFDNIEIKLICLLLAVVMWLYANRGIDELTATIGNDQGIITFHGIPIKLVGLQKQWEANPSAISLKVKCSTAEIETSKFEAIVRLTGKDEDEEEFQVTLNADNVELPEGLTFVRAKPDEITLRR